MADFEVGEWVRVKSTHPYGPTGGTITSTGGPIMVKTDRWGTLTCWAEDLQKETSTLGDHADLAPVPKEVR